MQNQELGKVSQRALQKDSNIKNLLKILKIQLVLEMPGELRSRGVCLGANGAREEGHGAWKMEKAAFHQKFLPFVLFLFESQVTLNLSTKITKLKQKYKKRAISILKKHGSSLPAPEAKGNSRNRGMAGTEGGDCLTA